ncbi:hypothetical protein CARUB_v10019463mg [Capsella rubella]|uniref:RING-type E3 ubiquitin transferase n=1 Tax=Capsella rubella TaxID=81985 RepID=R0HQ35_9BRAS|nr:hypothetical protein CARUB_v10019463mg [Capsella rubella]
MTPKIPIHEMVKMVGSLRLCGTDIADSVATDMRETLVDEKIYIAVTGRDLESKSSLVWAVQNSGAKEYCIVHVHQPIKYLSPNMRDLQSKKAIYIRSEAPATCQIWFTCNGYLICSSSLSQSEITRRTESLPSSSITEEDNRIRIQVAVVEAENSKREARFEAKQSENEYFEEMKHRRETEKTLSKVKEELGKMRSASETRRAKSNMVIRKLQGNYTLSMKALRRLREEQEELKMELTQLREVSKLKSKREEEEASPSKDHEPPQYFICPITQRHRCLLRHLQDIMEDPHVAADGFTYEREAIRGWFERGHKTSPMTNNSLTHTCLVPNIALRSANKNGFKLGAPESFEQRSSACKDENQKGVFLIP